MDTPINSEPNYPDFGQARQEQPRRGRRMLGGLLVGGLVAGSIGFLAGSTMPVADAALHAFSRNGGHGWHGEHARERVGTFVSFALHRLDATDDQEDRIQAIVGETIDEMQPLRDEHHANRDELKALLTAPVIDRDKLEKVRAQELALAESFTRVLAGAIADTAEVLTAEQRVDLVEQIDRFHHDHHH